MFAQKKVVLRESLNERLLAGRADCHIFLLVLARSLFSLNLSLLLVIK